MSLALALVAAASLLIPVRLRWRRRPPSRRQDADTLAIARLLAVALAAGLPLGAAMHSARAHLTGENLRLVDDILARAQTAGLSRALAETGGPLSRLSSRLASAQVTGAPLSAAIDAYVESTHDAARGRAMEEARTLGVRLMIPLALLLLPGFVALVIGPYVLEQLSGFLGQTTS